MELLGLRSAVLQQEEGATNFFTNVNNLSEFIYACEPPAGVNIIVKMCYYNAERLGADNGSHVTLISTSAYATLNGGASK
ncbi:hypothetical protein DVH05_002521 [Phytophthora capsici]|nr:hypothetical protein DVH05_002521 [Phytophthora capsici]